jgi:DegV family protein with EDD domain
VNEDTGRQEVAPPSKIALVTDSTCDLADEAYRTYGTVMVPLHVSVAGNDYLDRVELDSTTFYRLFRETGQVARSSQPSAGEFQDVYTELLKDHDAVVSVHIAAKLSGTVQSAKMAAQKTDPQRVRVVDARHVSVGLGLVVQAAGEAVLSGKNLDDVVAATEAAIRQTRVYSAVESLDAAVRGGRLDARMAGILGLMKLKPLVVFDDEGGVHTTGVRLGFKRALRALVGRVSEFAGDAPVALAISHADGQAAAHYVQERLARRVSAADIPVVQAGAVLTTHVGLGTIAVAVQRLQSDSTTDDGGTERGPW